MYIEKGLIIDVCWQWCVDVVIVVDSSVEGGHFGVEDTGEGDGLWVESERVREERFGVFKVDFDEVFGLGGGFECGWGGWREDSEVDREGGCRVETVHGDGVWVEFLVSCSSRLFPTYHLLLYRIPIPQTSITHRQHFHLLTGHHFHLHLIVLLPTHGLKQIIIHLIEQFQFRHCSLVLSLRVHTVQVVVQFWEDLLLGKCVEGGCVVVGQVEEGKVGGEQEEGLGDWGRWG